MDSIEAIYFLAEGAAGFVLSFHRNIVFVEINPGDTFGQSDIIASSIDANMSVHEILKNSAKLTRTFTT